MEDEKKCRVGGMYESNLLLGVAPDYLYLGDYGCVLLRVPFLVGVKLKPPLGSGGGGGGAPITCAENIYIYIYIHRCIYICIVH